jgi:N-acetylglutamate synthase-like GNAT family acetyltransferase
MFIQNGAYSGAGDAPRRRPDFCEEIPMLQLRKPTAGDIPSMLRFMQPGMEDESLLPRTEWQVAERLRDYTLAVEGDRLVGLGSVALVDAHLAEVGALVAATAAVEDLLVGALLDEAQDMGVGRAFVLAADPTAWERNGFTRTALARLPEKRDRQCLRCPRAPRCRQVALEVRIEATPALRAAG